jgi:hypothetical protein
MTSESQTTVFPRAGGARPLIKLADNFTGIVSVLCPSLWSTGTPATTIERNHLRLFPGF